MGAILMVDFTLQGRGKREGPVKQECQSVHYGGWGEPRESWFLAAWFVVCTWDLYHTIVILQQDNDPSAIRMFSQVHFMCGHVMLALWRLY